MLLVSQLCMPSSQGCSVGMWVGVWVGVCVGESVMGMHEVVEVMPMLW